MHLKSICSLVITHLFVIEMLFGPLIHESKVGFLQLFLNTALEIFFSVFGYIKNNYINDLCMEINKILFFFLLTISLWQLNPNCFSAVKNVNLEI